MTVHLDPSLQYRDGRLGQLLDWWRMQHAERGSLPGRRQFDPLAMPALLPNIYLVDIVPPDRYRWRLLGTDITDMAARNSTGRYLDEIYEPAAYANLVASFDAVKNRRLPMRSYGNYGFAGRGFIDFEAIELPLAEDGETVDMVLGIVVRHGQQTAGT